jgi:phosphodiesterase/alkaline phosphatase D-like protein
MGAVYGLHARSADDVSGFPDVNKSFEVPRMKTLLVIVTLGSSVLSLPLAAQVPPAARTAKHVQITKGPELESARNSWAIISWTSNNPGGSDEHFGVLHYGTDPKTLSETAKSHVRLNPSHSYTEFRVRVDGLKPKTTYFYQVDSTNARGTSDGVISTVKTFTTE